MPVVVVCGRYLTFVQPAVLSADIFDDEVPGSDVIGQRLVIDTVCGVFDPGRHSYRDEVVFVNPAPGHLGKEVLKLCV